MLITKSFKPLTETICSSTSRHVLDEPNVIARLLKRCWNPGQLESAYAMLLKTGSNQDSFLMNQFISACSGANCVHSVVLAYSEMESPNVFVHNAMLRAFVQCQYPIRALECYVSMLRDGVLPTSYTFSSLIKACSLLFNVRSGEGVHGHVWKWGFKSNVFVQTGLIEFYSTVERMVESTRVFDEMPERDAFAWTVMLSGLAQVGDLGSAKKLFDAMPEKTTVAWNTLIDGYARLQDVESAELLFVQMPERDIISWTTMINCYAQNKKYSEAIRIFDEMTKNGVIPDEVTMSSVISACAHLGALELGKEIHHYVMPSSFDLDVYTGSALVDMYAKCGSLDRSLLVFYKLPEKNLYCWNSVIEGLAVHGYAAQALKMFQKMEKEKIKPNGVTFISVLSACTHAKLVEEGCIIFDSMTRHYNISPKVEHYGCMVDLLGKAGLLKEALELIRSMKCEPNAVIWGALLGACKLHKNLEIAQIAVKELMVLEQGNTGHYMLLINMYAESNRWDEAGKARVDLNELGVEKQCPGSSWIEMDSRVHQFAASYKSHPSSNQIYSLLSELDWELKLACYMPEPWSIL